MYNMVFVLYVSFHNLKFSIQCFEIYLITSNSSSFILTIWYNIVWLCHNYHSPVDRKILTQFCFWLSHPVLQWADIRECLVHMCESLSGVYLERKLWGRGSQCGSVFPSGSAKGEEGSPAASECAAFPILGLCLILVQLSTLPAWGWERVILF